MAALCFLGDRQDTSLPVVSNEEELWFMVPIAAATAVLAGGAGISGRTFRYGQADSGTVQGVAVHGQAHVLLM